MANLNLNKVILGGRLTADPELKKTPNGVSVTSFSIAINRRHSKEEQVTDFIDVVAWRNTAEFICKYFHKASSICLVGQLQKRQYTDKDGNKRYVVEVIADEAMFVDSKSENAAASGPVQFTPPTVSGNDVEFEELTDDDTLPF